MDYKSLLKAYMLEIYKWRGEFLDYDFYYENNKKFIKLKQEIISELIIKDLSENIVDVGIIN